MNFAWTDERTETLKFLWSRGHSAGAIAAELGRGLTRNAVIGKISRLNLPTRGQMRVATTARVGGSTSPKPEPAPEPQVREPAPPPRATPPVEAPPKPVPPAPKPTPVPTAAVMPPPAAGISLVELAFNHCRWPIVVPGEPVRYCGAIKPPTARAFCEAHARIAYTAHGLKAGIDREPASGVPPLRRTG